MNGLWPSFFRIFYHSAFGPHTMTVPTRQMAGPTEGHPGGTVLNWLNESIDVDDMINAFVDSLLPSFGDDTHFDSYITYFGSADPLAPMYPQAQGTLTQIGTSETPGWTKAVQGTLSFRTADFGLFKVTLLDCASGDSFEKITTLVPDGPLDVISLIVTSADYGFSGRDGAPPATFLQFSLTLNEKLRRSYRET